MTKILVAYGSVEGQTEKIAKHISRVLSDQGHEAQLFSTMNLTGEIQVRDFDKAILAGSVHERRHPKPFEVFLTAHSESLSSRPTLLISVSMSAAFADGAEEAESYVQELLMRTKITPSETLCLAGAIKLGKYDYYALQVLRHVVLRDRDFDINQNVHEFTQWGVLDKRLADFGS